MSTDNPNCTRDIDWNDDCADLVVQTHTLPIMVFDDPNGDVVIRQKAMCNEEDDAVITIARANVSAVIAAMKFMSGLDVARAKPAPMTSAERQRRFKERHRGNGANGQALPDSGSALPAETRSL